MLYSLNADNVKYSETSIQGLSGGQAFCTLHRDFGKQRPNDC
jgi:hypothetical protein